MIEFPLGPAVGQTFVAENTVTYTWMGSYWTSVQAIGAGTAKYYRDGGRADSTFIDELDGGTA